LERGSISDQAANRIMAMIKLASLKSGDQLPTEAQMTLAFGVSRPPLREALKRTMRAPRQLPIDAISSMCGTPLTNPWPRSHRSDKRT